jgi:hypothetical protein
MPSFATGIGLGALRTLAVLDCGGLTPLSLRCRSDLHLTKTPRFPPKAVAAFRSAIALQDAAACLCASPPGARVFQPAWRNAWLSLPGTSGRAGARRRWEPHLSNPLLRLRSEARQPRPNFPY